jgi:hypothetical protein
MKSILVSIAFLLVLINYNLISQQPPCMPDYYGLTYTYPVLQHIPQLTSDMPLDIMISYIVLDSVCKYGRLDQFNEFIDRQTYNDTIKKMMNYLYRIKDFDPIKFIFSQYYKYNQISSEYYIHPSNVISTIIKKVKSISPSPFLDNILLSSDYIFHIRVIDTTRRITPSANIFKDLAIVNFEIIDTIKGRNIPNCKNISLNFQQNNADLINKPSNCSQFEYRLYWNRSKYPPSDIVFDRTTNNLVDSLDQPWVKSNKEYIVFLQLHSLCYNNINEYYCVYPNVIPSETCTMYPIENGIVQDPGNEFEFSNYNIQNFKNELRNRIQQIIHY